IPICTTDPSISQGPKDRERDTRMKPTKVDENEALDTSRKDDEANRSESEREMQTKITNSTNGINIVSTHVSTVGPTVDTAILSPLVNTARPSVNTANAFEEHLFERFSPFKNAFSLPPVPNISSMDNTGIFGNGYDDEDVEEEVDMNNVNSSYTVPDTSFTKFHKDHPEDQEPNNGSTMPPANNGSTEDVQPPVVQIQTRNPNPESNVTPVVTPVPKASIPFPSRRNDERRKEKANDQIEKFYEIFRDLSFEISFTDALTLMPKFVSTLKTLLGNKEKLSEMARTPLNENCSADPGRFLIPCEFSGINTCNALADLGAS
ncbi:hypothetical protein Tco_0027927, partial [Tanacetum coccineum]